MLPPRQYPAPVNWQDFESLCLDLWREIWRDPYAQKNGRNGQPQAGVDIFGIRRLENRLQIPAGVQCKGKDNFLTSNNITAQELFDEVAKARSFTPKLEEYVLATTGPRDSYIQGIARQLSTQTPPLTICVCSWHDIIEYLQQYPNVARIHYSQFFSEPMRVRMLAPGVVEFTLIEQSVSDELASIFGQPAVVQLFNAEFRHDVQSFVTELALNARTHGNARWCNVKISQNCIEIIDNGNEFNPLLAKVRKPKGSSGGVGLAFFRGILDQYRDMVTASYERSNNENCLRLVFAVPLTSVSLASTCQIILRGRYVFGGPVGSITDIPEGCSTYYLNVVPNLVPISYLVRLIDELLQLIPQTSILFVRVPYGKVGPDLVRAAFSDNKRLVVL